MGESAACQQLRAELVAFGFVNLGICGDVRHCGGGSSPCSGGGSSDHCWGNAFDAGNGGIPRDTRYAVIDHILHDGRCTYCIHEGKGQRSYHRGGTYFDSSGHGDHFHTSIHNDSRRNDGSPWGIADVAAAAVPEPIPEPEDEDMANTIEYEGAHHYFDVLNGDVLHRWTPNGPEWWGGEWLSDHGKKGETVDAGVSVFERDGTLHFLTRERRDGTLHWWYHPAVGWGHERL